MTFVSPNFLIEIDAKMIEEVNNLVYIKHFFLTIFGEVFGE